METTERLVKLESDVVSIKDELKTVDTRLSKHGQEIDSLGERQDELAKDLIIIRKDTESIDQGVKRLEVNLNKAVDKLDLLHEKRVDDHFKEPLNKYRNLGWKIIGVIVGLLVTFVMGALFPMLVNK